MKKAIILFAIVAFAATSFAATPHHLNKTQLDKAIKAYTEALNSENPGLRNSAMYQLAVLKNKYPEANLTSVGRVIERLAKQDKSLAVRVNANLMFQYLTDEDLATKVAPVVIDPNVFFSELYTQVTNAK